MEGESGRSRQFGLEQLEQLGWDTSSWVTDAEPHAMSNHPVAFTNAQLRRPLAELQARRSLQSELGPEQHGGDQTPTEAIEHIKALLALLDYVRAGDWAARTKAEAFIASLHHSGRIALENTIGAPPAKATDV